MSLTAPVLPCPSGAVECRPVQVRGRPLGRSCRPVPSCAVPFGSTAGSTTLTVAGLPALAPAFSSRALEIPIRLGLLAPGIRRPHASPRGCCAGGQPTYHSRSWPGRGARPGPWLEGVRPGQEGLAPLVFVGELSYRVIDHQPPYFGRWAVISSWLSARDSRRDRGRCRRARPTQPRALA